MITQTATCVAQEPADEVSDERAEKAKYLEQQVEDFAQTDDEQEIKLVDEEPLVSAETAQDHEQPEDPIAPPKFDSAVLAGFRIGYRQDAATNASKTLNAGATATQSLLQMAGWVQEMKSRLSRKEFSRFVKDLLQWVGDEARKYLDVARAFEGFDLERLQRLEPFTLLKLRSKRYSPLIARLRDEVSITQLRVQELIEEVLPKKPRKQKPVAADGSAVLEKHANVEDGTFYFTLKEANLSATIGSWLENKLESKTLGQVLCEAMEQQDDQEQISALRQQIEAEAQQQARSRFEILEFGLKQQIAHLEAQLAAVKSSEIVKPSTATELESSTPLEVIESPATATIPQEHEPTEPIESATGLQPYSDDQVALESDQLNEYPDVQVASLALEQPSEHECDPAIANSSEPVASPSHPQPSDSTATDYQILAADWDLIQQLRAAESELRKIEAKIQGLNSQITKSGSNPVVEREVLPVLKKQQDLRSAKVSQLVELINSSVIPAYYEEQQDSGRVVLDRKYASDLLMQAQSWSDVVLVSGSDRAQLINAVKEWSKESKQTLVQLLSSYLETEPLAFEQIDWIPKTLLEKTLSTLSFTVQRIKKSDNLVDEPEMEYLSGLRFSSLSDLGTRREQWVFHFDGNLIPVFGRDEFSVEKF